MVKVYNVRKRPFESLAEIKPQAKVLLVPVLLSVFLILFPGIMVSQCVDTADFTSWVEANGNNHWLTDSPHEVSQNIEIFPPNPSFFVSDELFINVRFSFDVVSSSSLDDDFIGFVVGYRNPMSGGSNQYDLILFDWKAKAEGAFSNYAEEGFTLSAIHGNINPGTVPDYFWGHNGLMANSIYEPFHHSFGDTKGWENSREYHFEVFYMATSIKVFIDSNLIFEVDRCNQPGRIGFYTYSQHNVTYSNFHSRPSADIFASPTQICAGDTVFASITDPACPDYNPTIESWQWNWGDGTSSNNQTKDYHIYPDAGTYTMELLANFPGNCSDTVSTIISVQSPPFIDLGPDTTVSLGSSITLDAGDYHFDWTYDWSTGSQLPQITLNSLYHDTIVGLLVTSGVCQVYDEIVITVFDDPVPEFHFNVPNAFSPDGDGLNDIFLPVTDGDFQDEYSLFIYDRWGTEIFQTSQLGTGWNGTYKGQQCQGDIYVYLIKYQLTSIDQAYETVFKKGNVLLLR